MSRLQADSFYKNGLTALSKNAAAEAAGYFRKALKLETELGRAGLRTLSYFGLSLAQAGISFDVAIDSAKKAAYGTEKDPLLYLNLGRVYLLAGKRISAIKAFEKGLRICPTSGILRRELSRIDRRTRPVLAGLTRNHFLNRLLGQTRSRFTAPRPTAVGSPQTAR